MSAMLDTGATIRRMNELNYAIDAWLGDLARAGRSKATRDKYQWWLWKFASFLEGEGVRECDRITPDHCRRFLNRWVDSSPSTMASGVTALKGFGAFLRDETVVEHSPAERLKRPRRQRPQDIDVVSVTSQDVERMFAAAEGWQEILCLAVLVYMGPRRSAAARVRRRDVDLAHGTIRFREKGGKTILKPLPDELTAILRAAETQRVWASDSDYLIPSRRDPKRRERSAKVVYDTVKKIAGRAGVHAHVHSLRAAFAVRMDELYPGRLVAVQELLGHARIETTMVYLRRQDKAREMETVRGLTWGSSVFPEPSDPHQRGIATPVGVQADGSESTLPVSDTRDVPPAGFEPALPANPHESRPATVTDAPSLPSVLLGKLEALRERDNA